MNLMGVKETTEGNIKFQVHELKTGKFMVVVCHPGILRTWTASDDSAGKALKAALLKLMEDL